MLFRLLFPGGFLLLSLLPVSAQKVTVAGSAVTTAPFKAAAPKLADEGIEAAIMSDANSSSAVAAVGIGRIDVGLTVRPVTAEERAAFPDKRLVETPLAIQVVSLVVSDDVWASGLRALDQEQMRRIYEKEVTNWKELGGADHPIKFFNPQHGKGAWELLAAWLYGDLRKAPLGESFASVSGGNDTRDSVEFASGALSVVSPAWIDGHGTHALSIKESNGQVLSATMENARDKGYPLARRLILVTNESPAGIIEKLIVFMKGPAGAEALRKTGYDPIGLPRE